MTEATHEPANPNSADAGALPTNSKAMHAPTATNTPTNDHDESPRLACHSRTTLRH